MLCVINLRKQSLKNKIISCVHLHHKDPVNERKLQIIYSKFQALLLKNICQPKDCAISALDLYYYCDAGIFFYICIYTANT
jgi:hypothetical protein